MLTMDDKGGRGVRQMLIMDDKGGWGLANAKITEKMPKNC